MGSRESADLGPEVDETLTRRESGGFEARAGRTPEASQQRATIPIAMASETGERAGRAAMRLEPLAFPAEVASYLQPPVKTLDTWR
jgi:hypothetical protein